MLRFLAMTICAMAAVCAGRAQDGATALHENYRTLLDKPQMQVVHVHYGPHETLAVHDHSHYPTVYVYLSDSSPVRFSHDEAQPFTITRRPVKAGWFRVSPGRMEKHEVANLGSVPSDFLRVECKRIPLGQIAHEFRFTRDIDVTRNRATTDYASPEMVIRRYIVARGVERVAAETEPTLLIAFSPAIVHERGRPEQTMAAGSVLWLKGDAALALRATGGSAAHVLAIRLLN
jgi:hypothetical protein